MKSGGRAGASRAAPVQARYLRSFGLPETRPARMAAPPSLMAKSLVSDGRLLLGLVRFLLIGKPPLEGRGRREFVSRLIERESRADFENPPGLTKTSGGL